MLSCVLWVWYLLRSVTEAICILGPKDDRHSADSGIFKYILFKENYFILLKISPDLAPKAPIDKSMG